MVFVQMIARISLKLGHIWFKNNITNSDVLMLVNTVAVTFLAHSSWFWISVIIKGFSVRRKVYILMGQPCIWLLCFKYGHRYSGEQYMTNVALLFLVNSFGISYWMVQWQFKSRSISVHWFLEKLTFNNRVMFNDSLWRNNHIWYS